MRTRFSRCQWGGKRGTKGASLNLSKRKRRCQKCDNCVTFKKKKRHANRYPCLLHKLPTNSVQHLKATNQATSDAAPRTLRDFEPKKTYENDGEDPKLKIILDNYFKDADMVKNHYLLLLKLATEKGNMLCAKRRTHPMKLRSAEPTTMDNRIVKEVMEMMEEIHEEDVTYKCLSQDNGIPELEDLEETDETSIAKKATLTVAQKRRYASYIFIRMQCPANYFYDGTDIWGGMHGIANKIANICDLDTRTVKDVMRSTYNAYMHGKLHEFDAGQHTFRARHGSRKLSDREARFCINYVAAGAGLRQTTACLNSLRTSEKKEEVSLHCVNNTLKYWGVFAHPRQKRKTGSHDVNSLWGVFRHLFAIQISDMTTPEETQLAM